MFVKLSDGRELLVHFAHQRYTHDGRPAAVSWISGLVPPGPKPKLIVRQMSHKTVCTIIDNASKKLIATGDARCSIQDQFRKKTGIILSLRDATAQLTREERTAIWEKFLPKKPRPQPQPQPEAPA